MTEYLQSRPLLRIAIVLMAGIAAGRIADIPFLYTHLSLFSYTCLAGVALLLLCLAALLRRMQKVASSLILAAAFAIGAFLICNSDAHGGRTTVPLPYSDSITARMQQYRGTLMQTLSEQGISGDEYSIVSAMTLGERSNVSRELRDMYNVSGASHVFALSGLHLGIIFMLLALLLPTHRLQKTSAVIQLLALWTYVMLVGCHPSILRAAVMLSTYTVSRLFSRKPDSISVLVFTALLLLVFSPQWLFDIGFQMSFMSVLSIITCMKLFVNPKTVIHPVLHYLRDTVGVTIAAGLGVAPLIAHYFGRFSVYSVLANLVVSPLAMVIISLALLLYLMALLTMPLSFLAPVTHGVAWLLNYVVAILNGYLSWIVSLPHSSIDSIHINTQQTAVIYILIAAVCGIIHILYGKKKN